MPVAGRLPGAVILQGRVPGQGAAGGLTVPEGGDGWRNRRLGGVRVRGVLPDLLVMILVLLRHFQSLAVFCSRQA